MTEPSYQTRPSLLIRLRDGDDREAWEFFVEAYAPLVNRFLRGQGMQEADALDVVQDVLATVAAEIRKFQHRGDRCGSFRSWLFTIVRARTSDYWRREGRHAHGSGDSRVQRALAEIPANDESVEEQWNRDFFQDLFRAAANQVQIDFQETTWAAFWRTTVEQELPRIVAADLGISLAAVYMAKRRVLQRIRQQIEYLQGKTT